MKEYISKKNIIIFSVILVALLLVTTVLLYFISREKLVFKLIGDNTVTVGIYDKYEELGVEAYINKKDISKDVIIDSSKVDMNSLGTYEVTYTIDYKDKKYTLNRIVEVIDNESPKLTLIGNEQIVINVGAVYHENGCTAIDNYDEKVSDKIKIINHVNTNVTGVYSISYVATDSSGNTSSISRKVIVKNKDDNIEDINYVDLLESNRITNMSYISDGIYVEGYVKDNSGAFKIKLCDEKKNKCTNYEMTKKDEYYYYGNIKLSNLSNGTYYMIINSKKDEKVINELSNEYRIARTKIKNKLVTFNYENDNVKIIIEDFKYLYDIVIDPGHGGNDIGASNNVTNEKIINLEQSLYEKSRYEEHGLKVLLLREDNSYGIVMGDESWPAVRRKAYALGYYGVTSRITYSNHHNSSNDKSLTGWEIIVPVNANGNDLDIIYKIRDSWNNVYKLNENHVRIYTRNYNSGTVFTKENNEKYYFTDYYAVIRVPYQLFNIQNILYEGSYLSNKDDFNWYYTNDNWKKLSEEKINVYVNSLGIKYIQPQ